MKKHFCDKKIFVWIISIVLVVFFSQSTMTFASTIDYSTDEFDVNVIVNENNSYEFTEKINVDFNSPAHGIYRYIPMTPSDSKDKMKIDRIDVSGADFETYEENDNYVIKIGNADETVTGSKSYTITYRMRVFDNKDRAKDFMYLDLLPTNWETSIRKSTLSLTMPKDIDWKDVFLSAGDYGTDGVSLEKCDLNYDLDEDTNTLTIKSKDLRQGVGFTIKTDLEEGYWVDQMSNDWTKTVFPFVLVIIPVIIILLWLKFGRDPKIVKTVEFYAPDGLTPAEIGYILDDEVDREDMVSMIFYYASKGYLKIEEYDKNKFKLYKLQEIPSTEKGFSKTFFDGLFKQGDIVEPNNLDESFGDTYLVAVDKLKSLFKKKNKGVITLSSKIARLVSFVAMGVLLASSIILSSLYSLDYDNMFAAIPSVLILLIGTLMLLVVFDRKDSMKEGKKKTLFIVGIALNLVALILNTFLVSVCFESWPLALGSVVAMLICLFFIIIMRARTKSSAEYMGRILGLKKFIKTAELKKLKMLVEENPEYFYDIMPYAYVTGLSDKWVKKFKKIPTTAPSWYSSYNDNMMFNWMMFNHMMYSCDSAIKESIVIPDDGDSGFGGGGGFSGGGFSGGGFGGGGGGAW